MKKKRGSHSRLVKKRDGGAPDSPPPEPKVGQALSLRLLRKRLEADPDNLDVRLALAQRVLQRGRPAAVIELLERSVDALHSRGQEIKVSQGLGHLALAYAQSQRFDDARRVAETLLRLYPDALDHHFLMAHIGHLSESDALCEQHARAYLEGWSAAATAEETGLVRTRRHRHEVYHFLGIALERTNRRAEALAAYEDAIESRRSYAAAWCSLAELLARIGRTDDARAILQKARSACPRAKSLANVKVTEAPSSARPSRATISLCMILKNEEEHLPRCLHSVQDLVDEIIVVDTGSTDRTVAIAESFGARVYHHPWEGSFSKARNISMGYADCDWILIMDADEELEREDIPILKHAVAEADFKVIAVSVYNYSARKELYTSFLPSNRLVRRDAGAYYEGIVHNQLRIPDDDGSLRVAARIYHYGYGLAPEVMARKVARSTALLKEQLEANPEHGFAHFNLAQLLRGQVTDDMDAQMERVIHHASRAVDLCPPDDPKMKHIHVMALHQLVTAYINKGDYGEAEAHCHRALKQKPGYLDVILSLGHIYSLQGDLDRSRKSYLEYLEKQRVYNEHLEIDQVILLHLRSRHNALYGLGLVALMARRPREAVDWLEQCVAEQDNYLDCHFRLGVALEGIGETERARKEFERELKLHPENPDARITLTDHYAAQGEAAAQRRCLEEGIGVSSDQRPLMLRLARLDLDENRFADALGLLRQIPDGRDDREPLLLEAAALYGLERWPEAIAIYEQCVNDDPDDLSVLNDLGNCHFRGGHHAEAERIYRQAINAGKAEHYVYRNLSVSLAEQQKIDDAIFSMEGYLQLEPGDAQACGFLGDLYYSRNDFALAIDHYEKLIEHDGGQAVTLTRLGDCYFHRGALDAALMGYQAALKVDPEHEVAWSRLRDLRAYLVAERETIEQTEAAKVPV